MRSAAMSVGRGGGGGAAVKKGQEHYGKNHFVKNNVHYNLGAHRAMYVAAHRTMPQDLPLDI